LEQRLDAVIQLADGRYLGFSRFGLESAMPVLMFHGTPGSRYFAFSAGTPLDDGRLQVILPERPGYGLSTAQPNRSMLDWVDDILQLADSLGFAQFHLLGLSGGGPYALACAQQIPQRVLSVILVASVAPLSITRLRQSMPLSNKLAYSVARFVPLAIELNFRFNRYSLFHRPEIYLGKLFTQLSDWDEALLQDPAKQALFLQHMREAYRNGIRGAVSDIQLLMQPWGFNLSDIQTPVRLWQGELDTMVPPAMGRYLAEQLPNCKAEFIAEVGHLLFLDNRYMQAALSAICQDRSVKKTTSELESLISV